MVSLFGKTVLFAINKAWIKLSLGGDTSFNVLFIVEYQFSVGTSFSLDTGKFFHTRTCPLSCSWPTVSKLSLIIRSKKVMVVHMYYCCFE